MASIKRTTTSNQPEQTFEEWIAELQAMSSRAFPGVVSSRATKPAKSAVLASRRRSFRYSVVRSTKSLASTLSALHREILRGSFPGFNGGVAQ